MAGVGEPPWRDKPSIKYRCGSLCGAAFEIVDYGHEDYVSASTDDKWKSRTPEPRDPQICSTRELISALGSMWHHVTGPLSLLVSKSTSRCESHCLQECNILWYSSEDRTRSVHIAAGNQNHPINLMKLGNSLPVVSGHLGFVKEPLEERSTSNIGLQCGLHRIYGWMTETALSNQEHQVNFTGIGKHDDGDSDIGFNSSDHANSCISVGGNDSATILIIQNDSHNKETKHAGISLVQNDHPNNSVKPSSATLLTDNDHVQDIEACSSIPNSRSLVPSRACVFDERESSRKADMEENRINHQQDFAAEKKCQGEICFPMKEKPNRALAKQEHAFAGAMAGIFVSLSLHPVDTIKTVVQSCRADQRSLLYICQSIISQRGITGLYRGISTNIASSAPISAVYTFTYESIKGILLPFLPVEYQSVAHCMAGGCACIATSFIFTPSECIKQQMQVASCYRNCWNAFIGIIEKGGLASLYAGWGAVLCRNVPHSVIKVYSETLDQGFYAYESMKQLLSSVELGCQTNTIVALLSGGLAASTAALLTTPFDVIKTRIQTQIPGSLNRYPGVFDTLQEIAKNEGLKGLYRGLTPRLFMYATQGGLFFASYESFKILFSLEGSQINVSSHCS